MGLVFDMAIFVLSFLTVLGFLVFFHELGHYSIARMFNTSIERFSVGFGKPIKQWKLKNGEIWSIGRIQRGRCITLLSFQATLSTRPYCAGRANGKLYLGHYYNCRLGDEIRNAFL